MLVGLTYDLRADYLAEGYTEDETAEFDRPETIDAIENALEALGHKTDRIGHFRRLTERLVAGDRWDLVFNIAEGLFGLGREAQVPAILDAYQIPYTFSDPFVLCLCLHKGQTKLVVREAGVATPDFAVVQRLEDIQKIDLPLPLFAKPVAEGTGKGVAPTSKVTDRSRLEPVCLDPPRTVPATRSRRDLSPRTRIHRRLGRHWLRGKGRGHHGDPTAGRSRGRNLLLRQQGELRATGQIPPSAGCG